jgi:hypothetical protein
MSRLIKHKDILVIFFIFLLVFLANLQGFITSLKRERDTQRILDLGNLEKGLEKYKEDFGFYPLSSDDHHIVACVGLDTKIATDKNGMALTTSFRKPKYVGLVACRWGQDPLGDALDLSYPAYLGTIPADPHINKGDTYFYVSDGTTYSIFASLELRGEKDFSKTILKKKIKCGKRYCNFGRGNIVE